jgi:hypothetical protein
VGLESACHIYMKRLNGHHDTVGLHIYVYTLDYVVNETASETEKNTFTRSHGFSLEELTSAGL